MELNIVFFVVSSMSLSAWLGEVVTLNFIIVPGINTTNEAGKAAFIAKYFPRFFRLATVLALITILSGLGAWLTGNNLLREPSFLLLIAAILLLMLTVFHLFVESRLRPMAKSLEHNPDPDKIRFMSKFFNIVPRLGLLVIVSSYAMILISILSR